MKSLLAAASDRSASATRSHCVGTSFARGRGFHFDAIAAFIMTTVVPARAAIRQIEPEQAVCGAPLHTVFMPMATGVH